jgi:hypothetical protein
MKRKEKEKKGRKNKENLLHSPFYTHISKEKNSPAAAHSFQGSTLYISKPILHG